MKKIIILLLPTILISCSQPIATQNPVKKASNANVSDTGIKVSVGPVASVEKK